MVPREGKAANPLHSLAVLQKLAHHASLRTASAIAFPHDLHSGTRREIFVGLLSLVCDRSSPEWERYDKKFNLQVFWDGVVEET
jgi:hypothetical protein